jgi:hypothetical protein
VWRTATREVRGSTPAAVIAIFFLEQENLLPLLSLSDKLRSSLSAHALKKKKL